ncbi:MAG: phage portal protein [bacterium]|nr:phage portal protein [bacterium]
MGIWDLFWGRPAPVADDGMGRLRAMVDQGRRIAVAAEASEDRMTADDALLAIRREASLVSDLPIVFGCFRLVVQRLQAMALGVSDGGQLPTWLAQPNTLYSWTDCVSQMAWSLLFHGEMVLARQAVAGGRTSGFVVLNPDLVTDVVVDAYDVLPPQMIAYRGQVLPDARRTRYLALPGRVSGYGPGHVLPRQAELARMSEETILRHFKQGARFQVVFTLPSGMSPEAFQEAERRLRAFYTGVAASWRPPVVSSDVGVTTMSQSADQAQYLQLSQWEEAKIAAQVFGIDPTHFRIYLSGSNLTYANMRDLEGRLWRDSVRPLAQQIEEGISDLMAPGRRLDMLEGQVLTGGPHDRAAYAQQLANINSTLGLKLIPLDKILEVLQLPPTDGVDPEPLPAGRMATPLREEQNAAND